MKRIAFVTGGTGGHIYPALALADRIRQKGPDTEILFLGNKDRMEAELIPNAGYEFYGLKTRGLSGSIFNKAMAGFEMVGAVSAARRVLKEFRPEVVVGFGGYVSAPVILAAHGLGIPTVIHEQNSVAGKANRLVKNQADLIVTCYERAGQSFPAEKTMLLGNPRATVAAKAQGDRDYFLSLGLDPDKDTILIMMGSLGSETVNRYVARALDRQAQSLQFLITTGKDNAGDLDLFAGREDVVAVPYVDTLKLYPFLQGLICRAGATTLAEITAVGLPSILIPSPYVAENHQFYNASVLAERGAATMVEEKDLARDPYILKDRIQGFFGCSMIRENAARKARLLGKPNAADDMIEQLERLVHEA